MTERIHIELPVGCQAQAVVTEMPMGSGQRIQTQVTCGSRVLGMVGAFVEKPEDGPAVVEAMTQEVESSIAASCTYCLFSPRNQVKAPNDLSGLDEA